MVPGQKYRHGGQWGGGGKGREKTSQGEDILDEAIEHEGIGFIDDLMEGIGRIDDPPESTMQEPIRQGRPISIPKQPASKTPTEQPRVSVPKSSGGAATTEEYTGRSRDAFMKAYVTKDKEKTTTARSDTAGSIQNPAHPQT